MEVWGDSKSEPRAHQLVRLDITSDRWFVAVCACGWRTEAMPRAGLAHASLDTHAGTRVESFDLRG